MSDKRKVRLVIDYDENCQSPTEWGEWNVYSFRILDSNFADPSKLGFDPLTIGMRRKLNVGTAFLLEYYEYNDCLWRLSNVSIPLDIGIRWDEIKASGLLIWEGQTCSLKGLSYQERRTRAKRFLEVYTDWCNGYCFEFIAFDAITEEIVDCCAGFIGAGAMEREINRIADEFAIVEVKGSASWLAGDIELCNSI